MTPGGGGGAAVTQLDQSMAVAISISAAISATKVEGQQVLEVAAAQLIGNHRRL